MKQQTYLQYHGIPYVGKHEKKWYEVHRVLGPAGPSETIRVFGLDAAKAEISGCWDWEIIREYDGKVMNV